MTNAQITCEFVRSSGEVVSHDIVIHRKVDELNSDYADRVEDLYNEFVLYANGDLHVIKRIKHVQEFLLNSGYGLSNTILKRVHSISYIKDVDELDTYGHEVAEKAQEIADFEIDIEWPFLVRVTDNVGDSWYCTPFYDNLLSIPVDHVEGEEERHEYPFVPSWDVEADAKEFVKIIGHHFGI